MAFNIYPYKKKNDKKTYYEYRIYYKDPITQKPKEKSKKNFQSKPEAQQAAAEMEKQLLRGYEQKPPLLKEYLKYWIEEDKKGSVRKNTYELNLRNINNHILPYFKHIQVDKITPMLYQKFINHLATQGYSKRTVEIIHGTMYNAYERAIVLRKVQENPCAGATMKGKVTEKEMKFIDSGDISNFLKEAYKYGYIYWIFFKLLIDTGLRKGEAAALQWTDIDLKERTITVNKTLDFQTRPGEDLFGDTKTYKSKRIIKITNELVNDLHFHKKHQNQNKLTLNDVYHHDLNLVLCRNDGNYMPKSSLFNAFERISKRAGLPKIPIHSTRHTHVVLLMEAGASMKYIQERLGHGSEQITSDVYAHISKRLEAVSIEQYEEYMKNVF